MVSLNTNTILRVKSQPSMRCRDLNSRPLDRKSPPRILPTSACISVQVQTHNNVAVFLVVAQLVERSLPTPEALCSNPVMCKLYII